MSKKIKEENTTQHKLIKIKRRKPNRSRVGDFFIYIFLLLMAIAMIFPMVYAINSALKPLDELFMFHQRFLHRILRWIIFRICLLR